MHLPSQAFFVITRKSLNFHLLFLRIKYTAVPRVAATPRSPKVTPTGVFQLSVGPIENYICHLIVIEAKYVMTMIQSYIIYSSPFNKIYQCHHFYPSLLPVATRDKKLYEYAYYYYTLSTLTYATVSDTAPRYVSKLTPIYTTAQLCSSSDTKLLQIPLRQI